MSVLHPYIRYRTSNDQLVARSHTIFINPANQANWTILSTQSYMLHVHDTNYIYDHFVYAVLGSYFIVVTHTVAVGSILTSNLKPPIAPTTTTFHLPTLQHKIRWVRYGNYISTQQHVVAWWNAEPKGICGVYQSHPITQTQYVHIYTYTIHIYK